jgi:uncharacterized protein YcnI
VDDVILHASLLEAIHCDVCLSRRMYDCVCRDCERARHCLAADVHRWCVGKVHDACIHRKERPNREGCVEIPSGITFEQYEALPGWSVTEQKDSSGNVSTVTWTATSGGIALSQFAEFSFVSQNPKTPEHAEWNAFQYYMGGSIVEWTGDKNAETPHSITTIMTASARYAELCDGHRCTRCIHEQLIRRGYLPRSPS